MVHPYLDYYSFTKLRLCELAQRCWRQPRTDAPPNVCSTTSTGPTEAVSQIDIYIVFFFKNKEALGYMAIQDTSARGFNWKFNGNRFKNSLERNRLTFSENFLRRVHVSRTTMDKRMKNLSIASFFIILSIAFSVVPSLY